MGWPPCMFEGCNNWPSVGFTGVCSDCIKHPDRVELVAEQMNKNRSAHDSIDFNNSCWLAWLGRDPAGENLHMVLEIIKDKPDIALVTAIDRARSHYWSTRGKKP